MKHELNWDYDDAGCWEAASRICAEPYDPFHWRIKVGADGLFDIRHSDGELHIDTPMALYETLASAKYFCQRHENKLIKDLGKKGAK